MIQLGALDVVLKLLQWGFPDRESFRETSRRMFRAVH
jgi:hypothetical protein